jgi:hypothetical protein
LFGNFSFRTTSIKKAFLPDFSLRADIAVGNLSARKNAGLVRELTEFPNKSNAGTNKHGSVIEVFPAPKTLT